MTDHIILGIILRSLYIAIGAATLLGDVTLANERRPIIDRYREQNRNLLDDPMV